MNCFLIAEAGVNHNGSVARALEMVDAAADSGADAIKFQSFRSDDLVAPGTAKAAYQAEQTGAGDQLSMVRELELDESAHRAIVAKCKLREIEFMSTPFDIRSLELLVGLNIRRIKIASGEITNKPFLEAIASKGLPLILSSGMSTMGEIEDAVSWVRAVQRETEPLNSAVPSLTLLHCTTDYPAHASDVNLLAMRSMAEHFRIPVGYSDHTQGIWLAPAAVALGASVIEKHFTLDRGLPGPDHRASLLPSELTELVRNVRNVEAALGDGVKAPRAVEIPTRSLVRRSITLSRDLLVGHVITSEDISIRRPGTGLAPSARDSVIGRALKRNLHAHHLITWDDLF